VAYGDGVFVTLDRDSSTAARSDDGGETWTTVAMPEAKSFFGGWSKVVYGDGVFLAFASNVYSGGLSIARSVNGGQTWTIVTNIDTGEIFDVTYGAP
jgi:hypothetical protein